MLMFGYRAWWWLQVNTIITFGWQRVAILATADSYGTLARESLIALLLTSIRDVVVRAPAPWALNATADDITSTLIDLRDEPIGYALFLCATCDKHSVGLTKESCDVLVGVSSCLRRWTLLDKR